LTGGDSRKHDGSLEDGQKNIKSSGEAKGLGGGGTKSLKGGTSRKGIEKLPGPGNGPLAAKEKLKVKKQQRKRREGGLGRKGRKGNQSAYKVTPNPQGDRKQTRRKKKKTKTRRGA